MQVNFVVGGTQKGGTSALASFLRQHPEICMPTTRKELHYFDKEHHFEKKPNYAKYHANFDPQPGQKVIGEATPIYMYWNPAPARIAQYNPAMKWIVVLRDPVARAYSHWNMERQRGNEAFPFAEAIAREAERCREAQPLQHRIYSYTDRGFYAHQVRRLFEIFGRERCLVLLNEELRTEHAATLHRVFEFLGVDPSFLPPPENVFEHDYEGGIDPALQSNLRARFAADIKALEQLIGRDLSAWHSPT